MDARTDDELLAATRAQPEAFAVFYRRHVAGVIAYFARRTRCAETAADLAAETFAAALDGAHRHRPEKGPAVGLAVRDRAAPAHPRRPEGGGRGSRAQAARA